MPSTPVSVIPNSSTTIALAILPANSFAKPAAGTFKTLVAANDIGIKFDNQTVDVSTYGSGFSTQEVKVSGSFSADLNGIVAAVDDVYKTILVPLGGNTDSAKQNVYFTITAPNGDKFEGAAQISNLQLSYKLRDVYRYQFMLKGQGEVLYTPVTP